MYLDAPVYIWGVQCIYKWKSRGQRRILQGLAATVNARGMVGAVMAGVVFLGFDYMYVRTIRYLL